ncbi:hypothetical protein F5888DRAFT_301559 [Russula emetica]|nr:hypothetical protein F5888DRAFT_301559 [Russula emetica]
MQDIYRLRKILKQEEAARSIMMSSDGDQPSNYEHSEGSIIEEDEEHASETGSTTEVDDDLDVLDDQSDGYADPGILTSSPPPSSAIPHLYTAGAAAGMEFAASPVMPAASMEPTVSPASSMAPAISPVVPADGMESAALPVVPATQATHYIPPPPPPPVPPPHNMPGWYMPPPVVVYIPHPPYQMTLYPLYPVYFPPPTR